MLAQRYVLYLIKAVQIAVMAELLSADTLAEGQGQLRWGRERVAERFGEVSGMFVVDQIVTAVVRGFSQLVYGLVSWLPGTTVRGLARLVGRVVHYAVTYVDEAILARTFWLDDGTVWQNARDGVVLYAMVWKPLLVNALALMLLVWSPASSWSFCSLRRSAGWPTPSGPGRGAGAFSLLWRWAGPSRSASAIPSLWRPLSRPTSARSRGLSPIPPCWHGWARYRALMNLHRGPRMRQPHNGSMRVRRRCVDGVMWRQGCCRIVVRFAQGKAPRSLGQKSWDWRRVTVPHGNGRPRSQVAGLRDLY